MAIFDLILLGALVALLFGLLHANDVIGSNPHRQIKALEELTGPLPARTSFAEKLRLSNLYGLSASGRRRPVWLAALVAIFFLVTLWLSQSP